MAGSEKEIRNLLLKMQEQITNALFDLQTNNHDWVPTRLENIDEFSQDIRKIFQEKENKILASSEKED